MSLKTWTAKYYRTEADAPAAISTAAAAAHHSLRKWRGLRIDVLKSHGMFRDVEGRTPLIVEEDPGTEAFYIDQDSCALCAFAESKADPRMAHEICCSCPLAACFGKPCDWGNGNPFGEYSSYGNPEPMIEALTELYARLKKGEKFENVCVHKGNLESW